MGSNHCSRGQVSATETSLLVALAVGCHFAERDAELPNRIRLVEHDGSGDTELIVPIGERMRADKDELRSYGQLGNEIQRIGEYGFEEIVIDDKGTPLPRTGRLEEFGDIRQGGDGGYLIGKNAGDMSQAIRVC